MLFGCRFINFDYTVWFETIEDCTLYGRNAGFEFVVVYKQ